MPGVMPPVVRSRTDSKSPERKNYRRPAQLQLCARLQIADNLAAVPQKPIRVAESAVCRTLRKVTSSEIGAAIAAAIIIVYPIGPDSLDVPASSRRICGKRQGIECQDRKGQTGESKAIGGQMGEGQDSRSPPRFCSERAVMAGTTAGYQPRLNNGLARPSSPRLRASSCCLSKCFRGCLPSRGRGLRGNS